MAPGIFCAELHGLLNGGLFAATDVFCLIKSWK